MGNIDVPIVDSRHCTVPHNWSTSQVALADPKVEPAETKVERAENNPSCFWRCIFTFFVFQKLISGD
jgi:hypothetical protein